MSKWLKKRTLLVTAIVRNVGVHGVNWNAVAKEVDETPKACESAFWRAEQEEQGQLGDDIRILKARIAEKSYVRMLPDFPGYTIDSLKARMDILADGENNAWTQDERIAFFDLEFYNFDADFGFLLSWSIKHLDGPIIHSVITRDEAITYDKLDKRLCEEFLKAIEDVDLLVGFFSTRTDVPYIRSRSLWWGLDFPVYGEKKHHDMFYTGRRLLKTHRKSQAAIGAFLLKAESQKNHVDMALWNRARLGDPEALGYVLDHNDRDVIDLEAIYKILTPFVRMKRNSI